MCLYMPEIGIIGEKSFFFEKLLQSTGKNFQFLDPGVLGSPFLPKFNMIIIPTGFANPQYSKILPSLKACKSKISDFVKQGGILTIFGPLVPEHNYEWLSLPIKYMEDCKSTELIPNSYHFSSNLVDMPIAECDGYLEIGDDFETVLNDSQGRPVLVKGHFGKGTIIATTIHEFPSVDYLCRAAEKGNPTKIG